ncbi:MAG: nucleotidyltransferase domain-containing protein [Propionibacterium sp.]|nr:nucleotidyltransferase domain-containing protein [Propionibacterium sp.]
MDLSDGIAAVLPTVEGRVLQVLARTDMPLSGSRIASFIPTASREGVRLALRRLVHSGLVLAQSAPPALMHAANRRHLLWPAIEQLVLVADQVVYALKLRIVEQVEALFPRETGRISLALFGSVARGESGPDSDVDVLLITPDDLDAALVEALVIAIIDDVGSATGNECNVYAITRARFDELATNDDPIISSWRADAVVFSGPDFHRRLTGAPWHEQ